MWWGKVRSRNRQQQLNHLPHELADELERDSERYSEVVLSAPDLKAAAYLNFAMARSRAPDGKARGR
ncbi:hypothetical protein BH24GEM1_BH24GEM1_30260 [soil metagenome]